MRRIIFLVVFVLLFVSNTAFGWYVGKNGVVEPGSYMVEFAYTVQPGDTLWKLYKDFYPDKPTFVKCKAIAMWRNQITDPKMHLRVGQKLEFPRLPLVLPQDDVGTNRTTMSLRKSIKLALKSSAQSLKDDRIDIGRKDVKYDLPGVDEVLKALKSSNKTHRLNGEYTIAATFGRNSQGWTLIRTKKKLSGKMAELKVNKFYNLRVIHAKQCNNVYMQLVKRSKSKKARVVKTLNAGLFKLKHLRPRGQIKKVKKTRKAVVDVPIDILKLPPLPPPPRVRNLALQAQLDLAYAQTVNREKKILSDLSAGQFVQDYNDGASDVSSWLYFSLRRELFKDDLGTHFLGIGFNGSHWDGEWNDPNNPGSAPYNFNGIFYNPYMEYRLLDSNAREWIAKVGYFDRKDEGSRTDSFGTYDTLTKYRGATAEIGLDDNSRYGETFFSRTQFAIGFQKEFSQRRTSTYTDNAGVTMLNEVPLEIDALSAKANFDILADPYGLTTLSVNTWGQITEDSAKTGKVVPMIGILNNSIKFGYEWTFTDRSNASSTGNGLAWELNLMYFHDYVVNNWINPPPGNPDMVEDNISGEKVRELVEGSTISGEVSAEDFFSKP